MSQVEQIRSLFTRAEAATTGNETLELLREAIEEHDDFALNSEDADATAVACNIRNSYLKSCFLALPTKPRTGADEHGEFIRFLVLEAAEDTRDFVMYDMKNSFDAFLSIHKSHRDSHLRAAVGEP